MTARQPGGRRQGANAGPDPIRSGDDTARVGATSGVGSSAHENYRATYEMDSGGAMSFTTT